MLIMIKGERERERERERWRERERERESVCVCLSTAVAGTAKCARYGATQCNVRFAVLLRLGLETQRHVQIVFTGRPWVSGRSTFEKRA